MEEKIKETKRADSPPPHSAVGLHRIVRVFLIGNGQKVCLTGGGSHCRIPGYVTMTKRHIGEEKLEPSYWRTFFVRGVILAKISQNCREGNGGGWEGNGPFGPIWKLYRSWKKSTPSRTGPKSKPPPPHREFF